MNIIKKLPFAVLFLLLFPLKGAALELCSGFAEKRSSVIEQVENQFFCHGRASEPIIFESEIPPSEITWTNNNPEIGLSASGTGNIPSFIPKNEKNDSVTAQIIVTAQGYESEPMTFTITVNPVPILKPVPDRPGCAGLIIEINFEVEQDIDSEKVVYHWSHQYPEIGLPAEGTGNINFFVNANFLERVYDTVAVTASFIDDYGNLCRGEPLYFTLVINPMVYLTSDLDCGGICSGEIFEYEITTPYDWVLFTWKRYSGPNINNGELSQGEGCFINERLINKGTEPEVVGYEITLIPDNYCGITSVFIIVTVNPMPAVSISESPSFCSKIPTAAIPCVMTPKMLVEHKILFDENALKAGFANMEDFEMMAGADAFSFPIPENVREGYFSGNVVFRYDSCETAPQPFSFKIFDPQITLSIESGSPECSREGTTLATKVTPSNDRISYQWYKNSEILPEKTERKIQVYEKGAYSVRVEYLGCEEELMSDVIEIDGIEIKMKWNDVLYVDNPHFGFTDYQWYRNGYAIGKDGKAQYYALPEPQAKVEEYQVKMFSSDGSFITSCPFFRVTETFSPSWRIAPNPVKSGDEIHFYENIFLNGLFCLYDVKGKMLVEKRITTERFSYRMDFPTGVYLLRVITEHGKIITKKIVIQ